MAEAGQILAEKLVREAGKVAGFFHSLPADSFDRQVYSGGAQWSARSILLHLLSTETAIHNLLKDILAGGPGAPEGFDIDRFNEADIQRYAGMNLAALLADFQAARQQTAGLIAPLDETGLARLGRHPFLGVVPLSEMVKLLYLHNQMHLRDIRRALEPNP